MAEVATTEWCETMRRLRLFIVGVIIVTGLIRGVSAESGGKPNILYIFADDLSHRAVSCYPEAYRWVDTPNIDRLAREGMRFARAYTGVFCVPSRASALTGNLQHSVSRKVDINSEDYYRGKKEIQWDAVLGIQRISDFWPRRLRAEAGYYNGIIGKWHIKAQPPAFGLDWDWGVWWDKYLPGNYGGSRYYYGQMDRLNAGPPFDLRGYSVDRHTDFAVQFIGDARRHGKPWYLWLCYSGVHGPWTPAERHLEEYSDVKNITPPADIFPPRPGKMVSAQAVNMWRKDNNGNPVDFTENVLQYHRAVCAIDEGVGRLLQALEKTGQLDSTVIIFTGDQGLAWGQHGWRGKKTTGYDDSIRNPLIVRYPPLVKQKGSVSHVPVNGVDTVQTIHELAGIEPRAYMDGTSYTAILRDAGAGLPRKAMIMSHTKPTFGDRIPNRMKKEQENAVELVRRFRSGEEVSRKGWKPPFAMMCTDRYKYIRSFDVDEIEEVYDLRNDTGELHNLALSPEFRPRLRELRQLCIDEFRETRWDVDTGGKHFIDLFPEPRESVMQTDR